MIKNKPYGLRAGYYHNYTGICKDKEGNFTTNEVVDKLNEQDARIRELERINNICEEQITELRRLVHIVTNNDFIKKSKKEEWKKELMKE